VDDHLEDFAEALIEAEGLGDDEVPDLLAVSFSALDTVGHGFGPDAPETLDTILRLDRTLQKLFDFVDGRIGLENVVVAFSADHGVGIVPELVVRDGGEGGRFGADQTICLQQLQASLAGSPGGTEFLLDTFYLDLEAIAAANVDQAAVESEIIDTMGLADERFWNDTDCNFRVGWDDRLGQDRRHLDRNFSGFAGIEQEDAVIAVSMGPIVDRSKEYLVPSDAAVIRLRKRLLESVRLNEAGKEPLGLAIESYSTVRARAETILTEGERWQDLVSGNTATPVRIAAE